jgi:shikimate dehydrogenase
MQNAAMTALQLNWRYLALEVHPDQLRQAITGAGAMGFLGLNLTVPHKVLAVDLVDVLDPAAQGWGAVNTIRFEAQDEAGVWRPLREFASTAARLIRAHGFNTDADAITRSIQEDLGLPLKGSRVVLLGAGGAGRTAALKLASDGAAHLHLVNRTASKAEAVAAEIRKRFPGTGLTVGYPGPGQDVDLVLNATSLGLNEQEPLPLDLQALPLRRARAVYDMVYRPAETPLLRAAQEAGCRVANGLGMLLYQGAAALELWCGQNPPIEQMRAALRRNIYGEGA